MPLPIGTVVVMRMGRSRDQRIAHLQDAHGITDADVDWHGRDFTSVTQMHGRLHRADPDGHRHTDTCPACCGRSKLHSCQFFGAGSYQVNEGSKNQKPCLACADLALHHSCGLKGLQRMLSW